MKNIASQLVIFFLMKRIFTRVAKMLHDLFFINLSSARVYVYINLSRVKMLCSKFQGIALLNLFV